MPVLRSAPSKRFEQLNDTSSPRRRRRSVSRATPPLRQAGSGGETESSPTVPPPQASSGGSHSTKRSLPALLSFSELAANADFKYLADNEAIQTGYRAGYGCCDSLKSLLTFHNETVNVWSHAIGATTFLMLLLHLLVFGVAVLAPSPAVQSLAFAASDRLQARPISPTNATDSGFALFIEELTSNCNVTTIDGGADGASSPDAGPVGALLWSTVHRIACTASELSLTRIETESDGAPALADGTDSSDGGDPSLLHRLSADWRAVARSAAGALYAAEQSVVATSASAAVASLRAVQSLYAVAAATLEEASALAATAASGGQEQEGAVSKHLAHAVAASNALGHALHQAVEAGVTSLVGPDTLAALAVDDGHAAAEAARAANAASAAAGQQDEHAVPVPVWPVAVFIASAVTCMGASAAYHLFHVVDRGWNAALARADYTSIAVLIGGSGVPFLVYGFWCEPRVLAAYLAASAASNGVCVFLGLTPRFASREFRLWRMSAFLAAGLAGFFPFMHLMLGSQEQAMEALAGLGLMGFLYVTGALLYGFRVPERFFPGRFDLLLASHQIFHVHVFAACIVHYVTTLAHYRWRVQHSVCQA